MLDSITIRPLKSLDSGAFCELVQGNITRFLDSGLAMLPTEENGYMRWLPPVLPPDSSDKNLKVVYGIFIHESGEDPDTHRLAGFVGIESVSQFNGVGVWYGLGREFRRRGLAKTGVLASMADFASQLSSQNLPGSPRWVLHTLKKNITSSNLAASIGFTADANLDYTRRISTRGGQRFSGFVLERSGYSIGLEAAARLQVVAMTAEISATSAVCVVDIATRRRLKT